MQRSRRLVAGLAVTGPVSSGDLQVVNDVQVWAFVFVRYVIPGPGTIFHPSIDLHSIFTKLFLVLLYNHVSFACSHVNRSINLEDYLVNITEACSSTTSLVI